MTRISATLAAATLFLGAGSALAQRAPSSPPVVFTPRNTVVVPWIVAQRDLMSALRRAKLPRPGASLRREYGDHPRRIRVNAQQVSFWDGGEPRGRRVVGFAEGDLVLIDMWLDKVWGAGVPLRASTASDRRSRMRSYEAANRHRIVAEDATRARDYDGAIEGFEAALETDPTWPSGNFNLALLYEAVEDWEEAARYMRRFLLLEPDSPEAPAAREKVILWEGRARRAPGTRN